MNRAANISPSPGGRVLGLGNSELDSNPPQRDVEPQEVRDFFEGLELVEPGLVNITAWRPDGREEDQSQQWIVFGGVGRKPA